MGLFSDCRCRGERRRRFHDTPVEKGLKLGLSAHQHEEDENETRIGSSGAIRSRI